MLEQVLDVRGRRDAVLMEFQVAVTPVQASQPNGFRVAEPGNRDGEATDAAERSRPKESTTGVSSRSQVRFRSGENKYQILNRALKTYIGHKPI